jgi:hypothetical protein
VEWASSSPADGQTVFACTGDTVTLTWQYVLGEGETVVDKKWYDQDGKLMAFMHGEDFFPTGNVNGR